MLLKNVQTCIESSNDLFNHPVYTNALCGDFVTTEENEYEEIVKALNKDYGNVRVLGISDYKKSIQPTQIIRQFSNDGKLSTVVKWNDGTHTVVTCESTDDDDPETAFAYAYMKKMLGPHATIQKKIQSITVKTKLPKKLKEKLVNDIAGDLVEMKKESGFFIS